MAHCEPLSLAPFVARPPCRRLGLQQIMRFLPPVKLYGLSFFYNITQVRWGGEVEGLCGRI